MQLTKETASEFDFIICLDASGSMSSPSTRYAGKSRWEEAQETILGITITSPPTRSPRSSPVDRPAATRPWPPR